MRYRTLRVLCSALEKLPDFLLLNTGRYVYALQEDTCMRYRTLRVLGSALEKLPDFLLLKV
jgi:hypothetical protein